VSKRLRKRVETHLKIVEGAPTLALSRKLYFFFHASSHKKIRKEKSEE
jgi:hypothetical protein